MLKGGAEASRTELKEVQGKGEIHAESMSSESISDSEF